MTQTARTPAVTPLFTVRRQLNSSPSVTLPADLASLPDHFAKKIQRTIVDVDRKALVAAWEAGEGLPEGVRIEHLRIS